MADLFSTNRDLTIKRHERDKLVAQSQILAREIRIEELKEEIGRCQIDIEAQHKVITTAEFNIKQQMEEKAKEAAAAPPNN
jgi:hypothetical protein